MINLHLHRTSTSLMMCIVPKHGSTYDEVLVNLTD